MSKKNTVTYLNELFSVVGVWSLRHRWLIFATCLLILTASVYLAGKVRMNNSFDAYFNESDPAYAAYLQYRDDFGSDEIAYLLYDASKYEHGVFDLELMKKVATLTERLEEELPFVKEAKSIANSEVLIPIEDGIDIVELNDEFPETQEAMLEFAELFMAKEMYINGFVSPNRKYGAIRVDMDKSSIDPVEEIRLDPEGGDGLENVYPQVTDTVLFEILEEEQFQGIEFYVSGDVPLNSAFNRIAMSDMAVTFVICIVIISLLLIYFFRSFLGVLGPLSVVMLSVLITIGFLGVMGWDMDMMFGMVPTLMIAIGIAHAVHIISEFRIYYAEYKDRAKAIQETLHLVGAPCLLTSVTTAAGFLAMSISPIKTIAHMAVYTSLAVIAAFFLSITLLTFFLSFGKPQSPEKISRTNTNPRLKAILIKIAHFNIRYPKQIALVALLVFATAGVGISKIEVDSNFLMDFSEEVPIRQTTEFIDQTMGGMGSIVYLFDAGESDAIKNPEVLKELERFQEYVNTLGPIVQKTYSIVDLLKDINQTFHDGDPAYYKIPESRELVAQYLFVYELSGGDELSNFISSDYSRANLEVRTQLVNSSEIAKLKAVLDAYQAENPLEHSENEFTGISSLWIQLTDYITQSQLQGVFLAFTVIAMLMCFIFRSVKVGLISMIPNVAPSILTVGLIGWLGVYLDYMKLLIAPIAIGIAVDDTIHLLTRYHHEFQKHKNYNKALIAAMSDVGRALLITSIVLVCGFSVFSFSQMDSQFWFGLMLALTIFIALVADFFVMPALILIFKPFGPEEESTEEPPSQIKEALSDNALEPTA